MGFGREMHNRIALGDQLGNQLGVGDITLHQPDVTLHGSQRFAAAGIGHGVQHRHRIVRVLAHSGKHEIGTDETGAAGNQQPHSGTLAKRCDQLAGVSPNGPASSLSAGSSVSSVQPPRTWIAT